MEEEIWRDIKDYEGLYKVSNLGRVKSLPKTVIRPDAIFTIKEKIFLKARYVTLSKDGIAKQYYVKTLVNKAFEDNIDLISKDLVQKTKEKTIKEQQKVNKRETYKVRCVTTGKEFPSINQANIYYDVKVGSIARCCKGIRKSAGRLEDGTKLIWEYINDDCSDGFELEKKEIECKNIKTEKKNTKKDKMFNLIKKISDEILKEKILNTEIWSSEDIDLLNELRQGKFNIRTK